MKELGKLGKEKVNEILKRYVKEGKIEEYYMTCNRYSNSIPTILIKNKEVKLYKNATGFNSCTIFTIYDYNTEKSVKKMLDTIIDFYNNSKYEKLIKTFDIDSYESIEKFLNDIKFMIEFDDVNEEKAIDKVIEMWS